ncbi:hypothetical protein [Flavobacterium chungangensis]|uniref:Uncharacterized protein n=1 Tax=Flavobacterium chungangensis TaxID=2708132 RepID=A0ABV8ZHQ7_9FLAO
MGIYIKFQDAPNFVSLKICSDEVGKVNNLYGYNFIDMVDLPSSYDSLIVDSYDFLGLDFLKNKRIETLQLYSFFDRTDKNFEVLNELDEAGTEIFFHKDTEENNKWFLKMKRITTINNILD